MDKYINMHKKNTVECVQICKRILYNKLRNLVSMTKYINSHGKCSTHLLPNFHILLFKENYWNSKLYTIIMQKKNIELTQISNVSSYNINRTNIIVL